MNNQIAPHIWLPESELSFHSTRDSDRSHHPLRGLLQFGPHSKDWVPDPIRVATLTPAGESQFFYEFMKSLNSAYTPKERRDYLPEWPGFHSVFGVHVRASSRNCRIELPQQVDADFHNSQIPHTVLAENLTRAIHSLEAHRNDFDVLFIYLPQRWEAGFVGGPEEDFDLHDHLKATTALRGMPVQLIREDSALAYSCRASVMWRIGLRSLR